MVNDKYQVESVRFASNFIFDLLIKKWEISNKEALDFFFKAIKGLGGARGKVFEVLAHRVLVKVRVFISLATNIWWFDFY
jgi:hypothetical protein